MANVFLETKRLFLRALSLQEINDNYLSWLNDEEVCLGNGHHYFPYTKEKAEEYVASVNNGSSIVLAIIDKESNTHIGNIALQNINLLHRHAEFAILLGNKDYWHKEIGREASERLIKHGFMALNLHRMTCGTFENNIGMQKLAKSLGFIEEGRRRQAIYKNGSYQDIIEYGLLKEEWNMIT